MHRSSRLVIPALLSLLLFASACSDDGSTGGERVLPTPQAAVAPEGQIVEGFAPGVDDRVAIIGIASTESLSMRALPGAGQPIVAEIPSTATDLFGFGEAFQTPDGRLWWLVRYEEQQGWIEPGAAYVGAPIDISVTIAGRLASTTYPAVEPLLDEVKAQLGATAVTVFQSPLAGGTLTTTIDVLDGADDSVVGRRVTINIADTDGSFRLVEAQEQALCGRGIDDNGLCT